MTTNLVTQQRSGKPNFAAHRVDGHCESCRGFLCGHAIEVPHLHKPRFPGISFFELSQCVAQLRQNPVRPRRRIRQVGKCYLVCGTPFFSGAYSRGIDQHLAHDPGSDPIEVSEIFVSRVSASCQFQKRFMNQGRGVQRATPGFTPQMRPRQFFQLLVHIRDKGLHHIPISNLQIFRPFHILHRAIYHVIRVRPIEEIGMTLKRRFSPIFVGTTRGRSGHSGRPL